MLYVCFKILFLSGDNFIQAVLPMQLIMPTVLFIGLSNLMGMQILVPTNREKLVVFSTIIGAVIEIIVNIFAIPMFGAGGAAFAGTIAEFSVALAQFIFLKDFILPILKKIDFIKIGLSLLLTTLVTSGLLAAINTGAFWTLLFSAIVYFAFYGICLLFQKEEFVLEIWNTVVSKVKK